MRISEAANALGTSARMLRYRESLGLLPPVRQRRGGPRRIGPGIRGPAAPVAARLAADREAGQATSRAAATRPATQTAAATPPATSQAAATPPATSQAVAARRAPMSAGSTARPPALTAGLAAGHRRFTDADLAAAALGLSIERRYDITPAALAFGVRVLADHGVRSEVAELGRRIGRIPSPAAQALDFEQERARRLLRLDERRADPRR